jgi:hypothetical protein
VASFHWYVGGIGDFNRDGRSDVPDYVEPTHYRTERLRTSCRPHVRYESKSVTPHDPKRDATGSLVTAIGQKQA